jgi:hypothetical protein
MISFKCLVGIRKVFLVSLSWLGSRSEGLGDFVNDIKLTKHFSWYEVSSV